MWNIDFNHRPSFAMWILSAKEPENLSIQLVSISLVLLEKPIKKRTNNNKRCSSILKTTSV